MASYIISAVVLLIALIAIFIFVPHRFTVIYDNGIVKVYLRKIRILYQNTDERKEKKQVKKKDDGYIKISKPDRILRIAPKIKEIYNAEKAEAKKIISEINTCSDTELLSISIDYGTGNAAVTAIIYGIIWQLVTPFYTKYINGSTLSGKVNFAVSPYYSETLFNLQIKYTGKLSIIKCLRVIQNIRQMIERSKQKLI